MATGTYKALAAFAAALIRTDMATYRSGDGNSRLGTREDDSTAYLFEEIHIFSLKGAVFYAKLVLHATNGSLTKVDGDVRELARTLYEKDIADLTHGEAYTILLQIARS